MKLAKRVNEIQPSATAEMFRRVAELRAQGVPLISLSVGEPDFDPPAEILEAAKRALETGPYGYTQTTGLPALRSAIAARSKARRGIAHGIDQIVVTAGAKHALYQIAQALYDRGDEVIIPTPSWVSYADQVRLCSATPVFVPSHPRDGFLPTAAAIEAAITPRTKAIILCSPNNPTGAAFGLAEFEALSRVLRDHSLWVVVDEIYAELCYDGFVAPSLLSVAPDLADRVVIVDGVSKSYAMTGFRLGWLLAPRELARACEALQSQITSSVNIGAQLAALAALSGDQSSVERMRIQYLARRDRLVAGLRTLPGLSCDLPRAAFYVFANVQAWLGRRAGERVLTSDLDVADWLLDAARVSTVAGSAFGASGHLRFSFAASLDDIDRALSQLMAAVAALR
ncbi:MAG TPA: pyridoxal phosphate-dependent aminotransferase [Polyangiales bacterium]